MVKKANVEEDFHADAFHFNITGIYPTKTEVMVNEPPTALSLKKDTSSLSFFNPKL